MALSGFPSSIIVSSGHIIVDSSALPLGASTEATLALIKAKTDNIDVVLSSRTKPSDQQHVIVDSSASIAVTVASLPLPAGASTEATLALIKAKTDNIDVAISTRTKPSDQQHVIVDSSAVVAVTAASLPLPAGASTEATLALIKAKTDNIDVALSTRTKPADQQHVIVDSSAVVAVTAASLPLPSGASTEATLALIKAKTDNIDVAISTRTKPADQQHVIIDSSASIAVTGPLTDTQLRATAVPISAASLPLPTGAATETTLAAVKTDIEAFSATDATTAPAKAIFSGVKEPSTGNIKSLEGSTLLGKFRLRTSDERSVHGDSVLNRGYTATVSINLANGGTETNFFLFRNPAASGKIIVIDRIQAVVITKGGSSDLTIYDAATVTVNGTAVPAKSTHLGGGAAAAVALPTSSPTTSARGTAMLAYELKDTAALDYDTWGILVMEAGTGILFTGNPDANNRVVAVNINWREI